MTAFKTTWKNVTELMRDVCILQRDVCKRETVSCVFGVRGSRAVCWRPACRVHLWFTRRQCSISDERPLASERSQDHGPIETLEKRCAPMTCIWSMQMKTKLSWHQC